MSRIRPVIRDGQLKKPAIMSRFPAAFRLPAFRFSVIRYPPGDWAFLAVGLPNRPSVRTPSGLPRSTRTSCGRGGCLLHPEDGDAHPTEGHLQPAPAASQRPVPAPHSSVPSTGLSFTGHQRRFTQFTRPAFPSPVAHRMERRALGLSPELRTPPLLATHVGVGTGFEHKPGITLSTSAEPPIRESTRHRATSCRSVHSSFRAAASNRP